MNTNETHNGQVTIGREFFAKIKLDYADWRWALVREFLQNCIDAPRCNSVEVQLTFADNLTTMVVTNNGEPMDEDTLFNKLLTLGGSGKNFALREGDERNTGGFGVAKSLLYYTHVNYSVHTGDLFVTGSGAQYETKKTEHFNGTKSTITIEGNNVQRLSDTTKRFASMCQWRGTLTLNGETLATNLHKGARRKDMGWGVVYTNNSSSNLCVVRLNGQPMFTMYTRYKGCVLIELTGKASETLTSNRDALNHKFNSELSDLLTALAVDKRSALREQRAEYKRYMGEKLRNEAKKPKAAEGGLANVLDETQVAAILNAVVCGGTKLAGESIPQTAENGGIKLVVVSKEDEQDRTLSIGPEFIIKNTTGLKTPVHYVPGEKFSTYSKELVKAWTGVLLKLYQLHDLSGEFSVGFVFDDESEAEHEQGVYGRVYYINPTKITEGENGRRSLGARFASAWKDRHSVISLAAHEFVHGAYGLKEHDEDYAGKLTDVMTTALKHLDELSDLCKEKSPTGSAGRQIERQELFGHGACAIVRWMGKQGWSFKRACRVLENLNCNLSEGTIRTQLNGGSKGRYGEVPELTEDQANELNNVE